MVEIQSLRTRLAEAEGQLDDETLGRFICLAMGHEFGSVVTNCGDDGSDEFHVFEKGAPSYARAFWLGYRSRAPDVSIDAAVDLAEHLGWRLHSLDWSIENSPRVMIKGPVIEYFSESRPAWEFGRAKTPPLAICIALVNAVGDGK